MTSELCVPGAPAIPGLTFRRFRGEADYPVMVAILDACNNADYLEYINTLEDIASVFAHLTNCDPYRDMLFAEVHGETVAFSRVWWIEENAAHIHSQAGSSAPGPLARSTAPWRCSPVPAMSRCATISR